MTQINETKTEELTDKEIIRKIAQNYIQLEKAIVSQLNLSSQHHLTTGNVREEIWKEMFERLVPHKFTVEQSVFIIDSSGKISNEVDLAIFDQQFTPYIFNYGKLKYIPIEAVAVVVQCKSQNLERDDLEKWVESIERLRTSEKSLTRTQQGIVSGELTEEEKKEKKKMTQTSTRPLRVLCHQKSDYGGKASYNFDFVIAAQNERLRIWSYPEESTIKQWYETLNHADEKMKDYRWEFRGEDIGLASYSVKQETMHPDNSEVGQTEVSLLTLTFQINQLLMLINNPMFFPHQSYVKMFNNCLECEARE